MAEFRGQMLTLFTLDPQAHLVYSQYTDKWFVSGRWEIADGVMLRGGAEHCETVQEAVNACLNMLKAVGNTDETRYREAIKAAPLGEDRYYVWNGVAFAETVRPDNR